MTRALVADVDRWTTSYRDANDAERQLVDAALRCIARWGVHKTTLDDIAREAGVSRATAYRVFPGGKDRLVEAVFCHEAGRLFAAVEAELAVVDTFEDLLVAAVTAMLTLAADHEVLASVMQHEPELVLPHFAFHQLGRVLALSEALCRPHLERFMPAGDVAHASDLLARSVLTFAFRPAAWLDPRDPASVRHLVRTYLMPCLTQETR